MINIVNLIVRIRVFYYSFLSKNKINGKYKVNQPIVSNGKGTINCNGCEFGVRTSPGFFSLYTYMDVRDSSAKIEIGSDVFINNNASFIIDTTGLIIGDRTLIGLNCTIMDSDFHGLKPKERMMKLYKKENKPIVICNDVFIGNDCTILKGVTISDNIIVGSNSVVTKSLIRAGIYAGNPAVFIKELTS